MTLIDRRDREGEVAAAGDILIQHSAVGFDPVRTRLSNGSK